MLPYARPWRSRATSTFITWASSWASIAWPGTPRLLAWGQPTGFAEALEKPGLIPSKRWKQEVRGEPWYGGETLSVAIGQGYTLTTPLQVATLLATVANGGTLYRPYVVLRQERMDGTVVQTTAPQVLRRLPLRPETLAHVQEGLWDAVNDPKGTGKAARHEQIGIAGKTGTAQVIRLPRHNDQERQAQLPRRYRDHAWFAAFAPYHDPRIVVVVFIEHAGKGGAHFASYATAMIQAYLQPYSVAAELVTLSETGQDTVR
ncbi:MAG: hypothetical protein KatS3mg131_0830 [Candidatus Tectimicrobiota bacterium]|nr:MAG: hypothetical protein KatS3mg131_0830 [Candidatus Tectomicrobia bacterium]